MDLGSEPNDVIREIRGVGGTEYVYEKYIEKIQFGSKCVENFKIQIGAMDYGFEMDSKSLSFGQLHDYRLKSNLPLGSLIG